MKDFTPGQPFLVALDAPPAVLVEKKGLNELRLAILNFEKSLTNALRRFEPSAGRASALQTQPTPSRNAAEAALAWTSTD